MEDEMLSAVIYKGLFYTAGWMMKNCTKSTAVLMSLSHFRGLQTEDFRDLRLHSCPINFTVSAIISIGGRIEALWVNYRK